MNKFVKLFILLGFSIWFVSCEYFGVPVREYFEYYTDNVHVAKEVFSRSFPKDSNGFTNISPEEDCQITFHLMNPQQYKLQATLGFKNESVQNLIDSFGITPLYTIEQNTNDLSYINYNISKTLLDKLDGTENNEITANIILKDIASGREFYYTTDPVKVNSAPPKVNDLCVMLTPPSGSEQKYVVCFNIPNMSNTTHKNDTKVLKIKSTTGINKTWTIDPSKTTSSTIVSASDGLSAIVPSGGLAVTNTTNPVTFLSDDSLALYYETDDNISDDTITYTVSLDDGIFTTNTVISNKNSKLANPSFNENSAITLEQINSDGTANLTINAPTKDLDGNTVSEVTICYKIKHEKQADFGNLFTAKNSKTIKIEPGKTQVCVYAIKDGYVSSDTDTKEFTVKLQKIFVNEKVTTSLENGSLQNPFKSINNAVAAENLEYLEKICIVGDIANQGGVNINKDITLKGVNQNGQDSISNINMSSNNFTLPSDSADSNFTIENLNLIGNTYSTIVLPKKDEEERSVTLKGSTFVTRIQIESNSQNVIKVASKLTTEKEDKMIISLDSLSNAQVGRIIIKSADGYTLTQSDLEKFELNNEDYKIAFVNGQGIIIEKPQFYLENLNGSFNKVNISEYNHCDLQSDNKTYKWQQEYKIDLYDERSFPVYDSHLITRRTITLLQGNIVVATLTQEDSDLSDPFMLPEQTLYKGKYTVLLTATINGIEFSRSFDVDSLSGEE